MLASSGEVSSARCRLAFVVESGVDVRLVNALVESADLSVLARRIHGGVEVSRTPAAGIAVVVGPAGRLQFAMTAVAWMWARRRDRAILVQGYGLAALAANLVGRLTGASVTMLVCSPVEAYYRCRLRNPDPAKPYRSVEFAAMVAFARLNARIGQRYVVLSHHLAGVVASHGTSRPIDIIPVYGVDGRVFRPSSEPIASIRHRLGLPAEGAIIFFSSRVAPEKDADTLLDAFARLVAEGGELWLLHRSGGYHEFLRRAEHRGIAHRVLASDALHPENDLPDFYRASDLCVQASLEEGLGFSVLEAMACGTPVVAAAVGGLSETVIDGVTGWTYPPGDVSALAQAIGMALADRDEAQRRTANGRVLVADRYERALVFDQLSSVLGLGRPSGTAQ